MLRRQLRPALGDAGLLRRYPEQFFHLLGKNSVAAHARVEIGVVELAAAHGADAIQHLFLPLGKVLLEPQLEQGLDRERQS